MGAAVRERVIFEPNPGPQMALLSCPIEEVFFGGARGGGKTFGFLGDWISHAYEYGAHARGIFFRRTNDELDEVQRVATLLFVPLGASYHTQKRIWTFSNGATIKLRFLDRDAHADKYQGHSYTWIAFDELTNWASPTPLDKLRACLRSGEAPIPKSLRLSGNPGGVGHNWVKARYIDPAPPFTPIYDKEVDSWRVFIPSRLEDNPSLTLNDPDYWKRVVASANGNQALIDAWRWGSWDIVAGGMFDDVFRREKHVLEPFEVPSTWYVDRSFDWGSSKPFAVCWWAEADGTIAPNGKTYPPGTLFMINEWYGWNGKPNEGCKMLASEIAEGILEREAEMGIDVAAGPADSSIFDSENGNCIAEDMAERGVYWTRADKSPGSRKAGWEKMRNRFKAAWEFPMEDPGLFFFSNCIHAIRTIPVLPRDPKKTDDVDTNADDHQGDSCRYRVHTPNVGHAY